MYRQLTGTEPVAITFIGLFAIINGAMIQIIMASRVLYGLATRDQLPALFARVHPVTQTPVAATLCVTAAVLALALIGRIGVLASTTSMFMLVIFALVNLALWRIKWREGATDRTIQAGPRYPAWVSLFGFFICAGMVILSLLELGLAA
jgi:amino acid transporter